MPIINDLGAPDLERRMKEQRSASSVDNRFLAPMFRALDGEDVRFTNLDTAWNEQDPEVIDPWKGMTGDFGAGVLKRARQSDRVDALQHGAGARFTFAVDKDPGRAFADKWIANKGVNPGRVDGGVGHMIDIARSLLGAPYVFGAAGPTAFDCSGAVAYIVQRSLGISLPHSAEQQAAMVPHVKRDQLQPGDLIFYSYGRKGAAVDHVEIYMGNGKQIGTSNPNEDFDIDPVDWNNVAAFGRVGGGAARGGGRSRAVISRRPVPMDSSMAPMMLAGGYGDASFSTTLADLLAPPLEVQQVKYKHPPSMRGPEGQIKRQLFNGFMDAGRPDLARMVATRAFDTWVQQESGWNPGVTSSANNHGKANDGLFQVWRGHEFNSNGQVSRMSPYEQARIIAEHFGHLTPADIRRYAAEIRAGSYGGWG
jgi:cell wall-associated NlpC family hydrolase